MTQQDRLQMFHEALPSLLDQSEGKYALVCDDGIEVFETIQEAIQVGFEKCGRPNHFLVKRIEPTPS